MAVSMEDILDQYFKPKEPIVSKKEEVSESDNKKLSNSVKAAIATFSLGLLICGAVLASFIWGSGLFNINKTGHNYGLVM